MFGAVPLQLSRLSGAAGGDLGFSGKSTSWKTHIVGVNPQKTPVKVFFVFFFFWELRGSKGKVCD